MFDGLKIHESLTTDHPKVSAALLSVSSKNIAGRADEVEQAYWLAVDNPTLAKKASFTVGGLTELDLARLDSMQQAGRYLRALTRCSRPVPPSGPRTETSLFRAACRARWSMPAAASEGR